MAISKKQPASFEFEGRRIFMFLCHVSYLEQVGDREELRYAQHFFIFDEVGGCSESRYFVHPAYRDQIFETLVLDDSGRIRPIWETVPNGHPPFAHPIYTPRVEQIALNETQVQRPLENDKLYAFEILQASQMRIGPSKAESREKEAAAQKAAAASARLQDALDTFGITPGDMDKREREKNE